MRPHSYGTKLAVVWEINASRDSRDLRAPAAAVEADPQLYAGGRGNAARAGVDPGRRTGRLSQLRPPPADDRADPQGRNRPTPGEADEAESPRFGSRKAEARRVRPHLWSPRDRQAPTAAYDLRRLRGLRGCHVCGRRRARSPGLGPHGAGHSRRRKVRRFEDQRSTTTRERGAERRGELGRALRQRQGPGVDRHTHRGQEG
jgi:hypothetical protein